MPLPAFWAAIAADVPRKAGAIYIERNLHFVGSHEDKGG
jgi:hypothetical protein